MNVERILISCCLLKGGPWRYDGRDKSLDDPRLDRWLEEGRLIPVCPEVQGGLPVPRPRSERLGERVINEKGEDVTSAYLLGSHIALRLARENGTALAILKEKSPSCGCHYIYDGSFTGKLVEGKGLVVEALEKVGIRVFSEEEIGSVEALIKEQEEKE